MRAEAVARAFHEAYEALAPRFGYETRRESAVPWKAVPDRNRKLMVATVQRLIDAGVIGPPTRCGHEVDGRKCTLPLGHRNAHRPVRVQDYGERMCSVEGCDHPALTGSPCCYGHTVDADDPRHLPSPSARDGAEGRR